MHMYEFLRLSRTINYSAKKAADSRECIEKYLNNKFKISEGNEVLVENIPA